ncbi:MAG: hypothetical protein IKV90_03325 [Clostridia bacterium]|nr:hypothetical protein [Clostridia bacterium]
MKKAYGFLPGWILLMVLVLVMIAGGAVAEEEEELMFVGQEEVIDIPMQVDDDMPLIEISFDGYELTFKDLLPETITYAETEDSLAPDMAFMLELSAPQAKEPAEEEAAQETELQPEAEAVQETALEPEEAEKNLVPLFTMRMEAENGDHVILLEAQDGSFVPVSFYMDEMPEGLSQTHQYEFIAAQTDVHVLTATLALVAKPQAQEKPEAAEGVFAGADYELAYAFSADAGIAAREEGNAIVFFAQIGGEDVTVFTLVLGEQEGDIVQVLPAPDGENVFAAIMMAECPQGLSDQEMDEYYAAQAAVSELMATMTLR